MKELPVAKEDIRYDPVRGEVTLSREKFDQLVSFARQAVKRAMEAEDSIDVQSYRARKADTEASAMQALLEATEGLMPRVERWLSQGHSIAELANRTGIPYATCHRILSERFGSRFLVRLKRIADVVSEKEAETEEAKLDRYWKTKGRGRKSRV